MKITALSTQPTFYGWFKSKKDDSISQKRQNEIASLQDASSIDEFIKNEIDSGEKRVSKITRVTDERTGSMMLDIFVKDKKESEKIVLTKDSKGNVEGTIVKIKK